jgi:flavin-dependent dehydrogenase
MNVEKMTGKKGNIDADIMIVGGGPAGISTWLHLNKYAPELAVKTVLIEKAIYPRDKLCGGAILNLGQDMLKKLEVKLDIPSVSIDNTEYHFGKEVFNYKERNFLRIVRRIEFDHLLANNAIRRGLQLHQDETLLTISRTKDGLLSVVTNKGKYKVKILIGADGALSKVRKEMNLPKQPRLAAALEIFSPVNPLFDSEFASNTAVMDFTPTKEGLQGYVWHFPCIKNGEPTINHGICDSHMVTIKPRANLKKIFSQELQTRNITITSDCWSGHPVPWFPEAPYLSEPNILLVGDAAGIEPLIGGGIHLSLLYGDVAALTIMDAFKNNDFSLKDYSDRVQAHIVGKYIRRFIYLANEVYSDKMNILDVMRKIVKK